MIMLSNATYSAYDPVNAAGWSEAIATTWRVTSWASRASPHRTPLTGPATREGFRPSSAGVRAAQQGRT